MSAAVVKAPSVLQVSAAAGSADAAGTCGAGLAVFSESRRNAVTPGSVAGGNARAGARPNSSHAPAPRFRASSNRNRSRRNIFFDAHHGSREAAVVKSQATELLAMDGGFDGRGDVCDVESVPPATALNETAIRDDRTTATLRPRLRARATPRRRAPPRGNRPAPAIRPGARPSRHATRRVPRPHFFGSAPRTIPPARRPRPSNRPA